MSLRRVTVVLETSPDGSPMPATIISSNKRAVRQYLSPHQISAMGTKTKADWIGEKIDNTWFLKKIVEADAR